MKTPIEQLQEIVDELRLEVTEAFISDEDREHKKQILKAVEKELAELKACIAAAQAATVAGNAVTNAGTTSPSANTPAPSLAAQIEAAEEMPFDALDSLSQFLTARDSVPQPEATSVHYQFLVEHGIKLGLSPSMVKQFADTAHFKLAEEPFTWDILDKMLIGIQNGAAEYKDICIHLGISQASWLPQTEDDFDTRVVLRTIECDKEEEQVKAQYQKRIAAINSRRAFLKRFDDLLREFILTHAKPNTKYFDFATARVQLQDYAGGIVQAEDSIGEKMRQEMYDAMKPEERAKFGIKEITVYKADLKALALIKASVDAMRKNGSIAQTGFNWNPPEKNRVSIRLLK